jgi:DNA-binding transcriptional LysR family regulator
MAQAPRIGPGASSRNANRHPTASASSATSWMLTTVTGSPPVLVDLARAGLGVAVVPAPAVAGREDVHAVPLVPEVRGRIDLARRRDAPLSPAARALLTLARAWISRE